MVELVLHFHFFAHRLDTFINPFTRGIKHPLPATYKLKSTQTNRIHRKNDDIFSDGGKNMLIMIYVEGQRTIANKYDQIYAFASFSLGRASCAVNNNKIIKNYSDNE